MKKIVPILAGALISLIAIGITGKKMGKNQDTPREKIPIIYSDSYNIRFMGMEKLHPFDTAKYEKIYRYLIKSCGLSPDMFYTPEPVTYDDLLEIHTRRYLESLSSSSTIARIAELSLLRLTPNSLLQKIILNPMKFAVGGTILGSELALKHGWAINLSGGYHHAKRDSGDGFCYFADIPLAMHRLWKRDPSMRALIIDLDAHQGNGLEEVFGSDRRVYILDVYNMNIYPADFAVMKHIDMNIPIQSFTGDKQYIDALRKAVPSAIRASKPDIIFYNAGTDILKGDPLGNLSITEKGIIERDAIIFKNAMGSGIPLCMVLSGGYTKVSGKVIGRSIENILKKIVKIGLPPQ